MPPPPEPSAPEPVPLALDVTYPGGKVVTFQADQPPPGESLEQAAARLKGLSARGVAFPRAVAFSLRPATPAELARWAGTRSATPEAASEPRASARTEGGDR